MKSILLSVLTVLSFTLNAQCDELFFSEYVEGWSNNKALEIYNPTDQDIDLANYRIDRYSNGSTSASANQKLVLNGTIRAKSVFVVVIDKRDPNGEGQEAPVWDDLQAKANAFFGSDYNVNNSLYFNGDDGVVLWNIDLNIPADIIGKIGERPGSDGWNNVAPSYDSGKNGQAGWTKDHSLIRKSSVEFGDYDGNDAFNVGAQWDSIPAVVRDNEGKIFGNWESLGVHESACGNAVGIDEVLAKSIKIFPQPSTDGEVTFSSASNINALSILDITGKTVFASTPNLSETTVSTINFHSGYYIASLQLSNGYTIAKKFVIEQ
jgi:hypothetical protein